MVKVGIEHTVCRTAIGVTHSKRHVACTGELHLVTCKRHVRVIQVEIAIANIASPFRLGPANSCSIRLTCVKEFLDILIHLGFCFFTAINRRERFKRHIVKALRSRCRECGQSLAIARVLLSGTAFIHCSELSRCRTHDKRVDVRRLYIGAARGADLVAVTVIPAQELFAGLRNGLEHNRHALRVVSAKRSRFGSAFRAHLDIYLVHRRHVVAKFFHNRILVGAHLFCNDTSKGIRTVHL